MVDNYFLLNQKLGIYDNFNIVFENKIISIFLFLKFNSVISIE